MVEKDYVKKIYDVLSVDFKNAKTELEYNNNYQLLIAVILSAQCTDKRVNMVTKDLFLKYSSLKAFAEADLSELEQDIKPCGFYHNKAKNIKATAQKLLSDFNGIVPSTLEELTTLPGVGRKTANVMLGVAFNKPAIAVDTHVFRVAKRLGLSKGNTPDKVEQDLMKVLPKEVWARMHHYLLFFGRYTCKAIKPECETCKFKQNCTKYKK